MQSFSFSKRLRNLIEVSPHFATLVAEDEEFYAFQFVFKISQTAIVKKYLSKVTIKCINPNVIIEENSNVQKIGASQQPKKAVIFQQGKSEIDNILFKHTRQIKLANAKQNSVIAEGNINLQTYIDPVVSKVIQLGVKPQDIEELYSYVDDLELVNNDFEISQSSQFSQNDIRHMNLELISQFGFHPMEAVNFQTDIDIINLLSYYYTYDALKTLPRDKAYYASTKKRKFVDKIAIPVFLPIPKKLVQGNLDVQFEVSKFQRNKNKLSLDEVPAETKKLSINVLKHVKYYKLPVARPVLNAPTEDSKEVFAIQKDANSNYVKIEKKEIDNKGNCTNYVSISENPTLQIGETTGIEEIIPDNKFNVFRCIAGDVTTTTMNPRVDGVVSGKPIFIDTSSMIILDKTGVTDGVEIRVRYQPPYASQFQISKRVWSGSNFGEKIIVAPYQNFEGELTTVLDDTVRHDTIYEYFLDYKTVTGEIRHSTSVLHWYVKEKDKNKNGIIVEITTPQVRVIDNQQTIRFNINTSTVSTSNEIVNTAVANVGQPQKLKDAQNKNTDNIQNAYYHKVVRINLSTGERETFPQLETQYSAAGSLNGPTFLFLRDDVDTQKKFAIKPIDPYTDYLYEVRTFYRNPLSLVKGYVEQTNVPPSSAKASPKIYYHKPYKWRQPFTSDDGTIPATDDKENFLTKKIDEAGEIGVTASYLMSGKNLAFSSDSLKAERVDANKVRLTWGVVGNLEYFDHFVVVKQINEFTSLLGAILGQEMIDYLGPNELGTITYYLIPVFNNFSVGNAIKSNSIIIDPEELNFKQQVVEI